MSSIALSVDYLYFFLLFVFFIFSSFFFAIVCCLLFVVCRSLVIETILKTTHYKVIKIKQIKICILHSIMVSVRGRTKLCYSECSACRTPCAKSNKHLIWFFRSVHATKPYFELAKCMYWTYAICMCLCLLVLLVLVAYYLGNTSKYKCANGLAVVLMNISLYFIYYFYF